MSLSILYPQVSAEEWCKRYGLKMRNVKCPKCGLIQKLTIPWATKKTRGLKAELHGCGKNYQATSGIPADSKERESWKELANLFT